MLDLIIITLFYHYTQSFHCHLSTFNCFFLYSDETVLNRTSNIQAGVCYSHVQPQVGFNGTGYAKLGESALLFKNILPI